MGQAISSRPSTLNSAALRPGKILSTRPSTAGPSLWASPTCSNPMTTGQSCSPEPGESWECGVMSGSAAIRSTVQAPFWPTTRSRILGHGSRHRRRQLLRQSVWQLPQSAKHPGPRAWTRYGSVTRLLRKPGQTNGTVHQHLLQWAPARRNSGRLAPLRRGPRAQRFIGPSCVPRTPGRQHRRCRSEHRRPSSDVDSCEFSVVGPSMLSVSLQAIGFTCLHGPPFLSS